MPKYDYRCSGCQYVYEVEHEMEENVLVVLCNECGSRCKKVISAVPVVYKASGFYVTDKGDKK